MSLFEAREWWSAEPENSTGEEECGVGCLCVANIDNDSQGQEKVVTGTYQGNMRVYLPAQRGFKVEDLLLEKQLKAPILQLGAGKFIPGSSSLGLAVLHPRSIVVYEVVAESNQAGQATFWSLRKAYEHRLERTAFNFTFGAFGGVFGKDYICVQSMDGQLSFFEHDSATFSRFLPNCLVPGPLCYVEKLDSLLIATADMTLECYKYHVLGAASGSEHKQRSGIDADLGDQADVVAPLSAGSSHLSSNRGAKLQADWVLNIGEHILDIRTARFSRALAAGSIDIIVLGEHTLFSVKENGQIRMQKRFDYQPCVCTTFPSDARDNRVAGPGTPTAENLMIASFQDSLMIYKDVKLVWAARPTRRVDPIVGVHVASFGGIRGMTVLLDSTNHLSVCYMGTQPPVHNVHTEDSKGTDYASMTQEHRQLMAIIRQSATKATQEPTDRLEIVVKAPEDIDRKGEDGDPYTEQDRSTWARDAKGHLISAHVHVYLRNSGREPITGLSLNVSCPDGIFVDSPAMVIDTVKPGGTPFIVHLRFFSSKVITPAHLRVRIVGAYTTGRSEHPRTSTATFTLPFTLVCKAVVPVKSAKYSLVWGTNRDPPSLTEIFGDVLQPTLSSNPDLQRVSTQVMTVVYFGGNVDVTILVSKKGGRYRVQSSRYEALHLLSQQLIERLEKRFRDDGQSERFAVSFAEKLPFADYFAHVDQHFTTRRALLELQEELQRCATEYRVIQKRLLIRFKDKTPQPLAHLDTLLRDSRTRVLSLADSVEAQQEELIRTAVVLSGATRLMLLLIAHKFSLDETNQDMLSQYLSPDVGDMEGKASEPDQGWEERTYSALSYLLRTALARGPKENTVPPPLEAMKDTSKLQRTLQLVVERLTKGMLLVTKKLSGPAGAAGGRTASAAGPPQ